MRTWRLFVLLTLLPGLLLRSGTTWRTCACAARAEQPSCCAPQAPACCCTVPTPDGSDEVPTFAGRCTCKVLATPWRAPAHEPANGLETPSAVPGPVATSAWIGEFRAGAAQRAPLLLGKPPPDAKRNLPLRI